MLKLTKPDLIRTTTGGFTTLGEFMYNNRHLIEEGYTPEYIYNISIFNDCQYISSKCNIHDGRECVQPPFHDSARLNDEFNNKNDIYLKIVKELYLKKHKLCISDENQYNLKLPVTPIREKLYYLSCTTRSGLQSPIGSPTSDPLCEI